MGACSSSAAIDPPPVAGSPSAAPQPEFWNPEKESQKRAADRAEKVAKIKAQQEAEIQAATGHLRPTSSSSSAVHNNRAAAASATSSNTSLVSSTLVDDKQSRSGSLTVTPRHSPSAHAIPQQTASESNIALTLTDEQLNDLPLTKAQRRQIAEQRARSKDPNHQQQSSTHTHTHSDQPSNKSPHRSHHSHQPITTAPRKEWDYDGLPGARGNNDRKPEARRTAASLSASSSTSPGKQGGRKSNSHSRQSRSSAHTSPKDQRLSSGTLEEQPEKTQPTDKETEEAPDKEEEESAAGAASQQKDHENNKESDKENQFPANTRTEPISIQTQSPPSPEKPQQSLEREAPSVPATAVVVESPPAGATVTTPRSIPSLPRRPSVTPHSADDLPAQPSPPHHDLESSKPTAEDAGAMFGVKLRHGTRPSLPARPSIPPRPTGATEIPS